MSKLLGSAGPTTLQNVFSATPTDWRRRKDVPTRRCRKLEGGYNIQLFTSMFKIYRSMGVPVFVRYSVKQGPWAISLQTTLKKNSNHAFEYKFLSISAHFLEALNSLIIMSPASSFTDRKRPDTICLFDVDGTLTPARLVNLSSFNKQKLNYVSHSFSLSFLN
jgi:hypothetical protein